MSRQTRPGVHGDASANPRSPNRWARGALVSGIVLLLVAVAGTAIAYTHGRRHFGQVLRHHHPVSVGSASARPSTGPSSAPSASAAPSVSPSGAPTAGHGGGDGPVTIPASFPNASNTGVPAGVKLTPSGSIRVMKAGTVISGLDVTGNISVEADNVTIKNVRVNGRGDWGIVLRANNLTIEDSEISGNGVQELTQGIYNLSNGNLTVLRTDISKISDGIATTTGLLQDNYIHDPAIFSGDHADMIQSVGGQQPGKTLTIRHNTLINNAGQTSAIGLFQDFGVAHDVLAEQNLLAGGGYTVYAGKGSHGSAYNIRFISNVFSTQLHAKSGFYGPVAYYDFSGNGNEWVSNIWQGTDTQVRPS